MMDRIEALKTSVIQTAWKRGARPAIKAHTPVIDNDTAVQQICKFERGLFGQGRGA